MASPVAPTANDLLNNSTFEFTVAGVKQFRVEFDYSLQVKLMQWTDSCGWLEVAFFDVEDGNNIQAIQDCVDYALSHPFQD